MYTSSMVVMSVVITTTTATTTTTITTYYLPPFFQQRTYSKYLSTRNYKSPPILHSRISHTPLLSSFDGE